MSSITRGEKRKKNLEYCDNKRRVVEISKEYYEDNKYKIVTWSNPNLDSDKDNYLLDGRVAHLEAEHTNNFLKPNQNQNHFKSSNISVNNCKVHSYTHWRGGNPPADQNNIKNLSKFQCTCETADSEFNPDFNPYNPFNSSQQKVEIKSTFLNIPGANYLNSGGPLEHQSGRDKL